MKTLEQLKAEKDAAWAEWNKTDAVVVTAVKQRRVALQICRVASAAYEQAIRQAEKEGE